MKFEHLVEVNDLQDPLSYVLSREQVWRGLVLRAKSPSLFMPYLDGCALSAVSERGMQRELRFGELRVKDQVIFVENQYVHYDVAAQGEILASSLRMSIEEPELNSLFVRFVYDDGQHQEQDESTEMLNEYRKGAYLDADLDTVKLIREFAQGGRLDHLPC